MDEGITFTAHPSDLPGPAADEGLLNIKSEPNSADFERARKDFPRSERAPNTSHASASYAVEGEKDAGKFVVIGEFGGRERRVVADKSAQLVENERDNRALMSALKRIDEDHTIPPEHQEAMTRLVASFERGGNNFLGEVKTYLISKAETISRAEDPAGQARALIVGWLGEKLSALYDPKRPEVVTVVGRDILDLLPESTKVVETGYLFQSKAYFAKLLFAYEEDVPYRLGGSYHGVFRREVRDRGYPVEDFNRAIRFNHETRGYEANPQIVDPKSPAVVRILNMVNNYLERPDAVLLSTFWRERWEEQDPKKPVRPDPEANPIGPVQSKAYYPWEVEMMAELTRGNESWDQLGGVSSSGLNLVVSLNGGLNFIEQLSPSGFARDLAVTVVRFPADAPREAVEEIGRLANARGYRRLIIQLLPYTRAELDVLIEEAIKGVDLDKLTAKKSKAK